MKTSSVTLARRRSQFGERDLLVTITEEGEGLKKRAAGIPEAIAKCSDLEPEAAAALYRVLYKMLGKR